MHKSVLDKGYVEPMTYTEQGDLLVVNAARCSFNKQHFEFEEKDEKLINYLAKHKHVLPFRHPSATFRIHAPLFVLRQLMKHSVGMSTSEVSRRYITTEPEFYEPDTWRGKADNVKQGSSQEEVSLPVGLSLAQLQYNSIALQQYDALLESGVCPEQARIVLPQSMYTTVVWTGTLLAWFHLWNMRTEAHAQIETQEFAWAVGDYLKEFFPVSWKALCEHC